MVINNVYGSFVFQKINKVRWKPDNVADTFIAGSWDDDDNKITLWKYAKTDSEDSLVKPRMQRSIDHVGDVSEMKFIDQSTFIVSSSTGSIILYQITCINGKSKILPVGSWEKIHFHHSGEICPVTDLSAFDDSIVSVGEDGRINVFSVSKGKDVLRSIDNADSCTIRCVSVNKLNEILTGNSSGQMKVWDLRSYANTPETSFTLSGGQAGFTRVTYHPTQTHIKLAGGEDGTITIWDLRNNKFAVNSLNAHTQSVSELMFHPERPEHLFSCSANGQLWHWDSSQLTQNTPVQFTISNANVDENEAGCPWMSKNVKNRITVYSLIQNLHLPINSLDVSQNSIISGCDNEAIYMIKNFLTSN